MHVPDRQQNHSGLGVLLLHLVPCSRYSGKVQGLTGVGGRDTAKRAGGKKKICCKVTWKPKKKN